MSTGKLRRDGSYRSNEGQQKLDKIRELADRIDGTDLSRIDSMTVFTVVDLLANVANRQLGRTPSFNERPSRWTSGATVIEPLGAVGSRQCGGTEYAPSERPGRWGRIESDTAGTK